VAGRGAFWEGGKRFAALKGPAFRTELAQRCGVAAMKKVGDCFERSQDPWGVSWAPLKRRKGKILVDSSRLRNSISSQPGEGTFRLVAPVEYAAVHQFGATIPPHSRTNHVVRLNPKTGRFVGKASKAKSTRVLKTKATWGNGIVIPARPFFPTSERGLPPSWRATFDGEFSALALEVMRR
jgi:phage gpG-like protein